MIRQTLNVLAVVLVVVVNGLANALPMNGQSTGEISDRYPVLFVPAGYVFSIWGVIYVGLFAYAIYQARPSQRDNPRLRSIDALFWLSCLANITWIFLWHYNQLPLTLIAMLGLLASLIGIYLRLDIGHASVPTGERWTVHVPFSVYLGWVTVATVANVTTALYSLGWNGQPLSPEFWAIAMLAVGAVITAAMLQTRRDLAYALVIVWAYVGVAVKQSATQSVAFFALAMAAVVVVLAVRALTRRNEGSPAVA
jgi:hypothetical protein